MNRYVSCMKKNAAATASAVTFILAVILYHKYLMGNAPYLYSVSDGFSQFLPIYKDFVDMLKEGKGISFWNFSVGFVAEQSYIKFLYPTNLLPILAGYFRNEAAMMITAAWMQVFKMVLAAFFTARFLKKLEFRDEVCCVTGIMYALCGVLILRGHWWLLGDECYIAMFILWAAECYYKDKKWQWIPVSTAVLACAFGLYYLYLYGLELFVYATVRYFYDKRPARDYWRFILSCGGLYLMGVCIAGMVLFDYGRSLMGTARYTATKGYADQAAAVKIVDKDVLFSGIVSLFDVNTSGVFQNYTGALNYLERPIFYCGLLALFLIPQAVILSKKRTKKFIIGGIIAAAAYMIFPAVTDVMNMFVRNEELGIRSYRMSSLWIVIFMVIMSAYGLECGIERHGFHKIGVVITGIVCIAVYALCIRKASFFGMTIDFNVTRWVFLFLILWTIVLVFFGWQSKRRDFSAWSMILVSLICILEMGHSARTTLNVSAQCANQFYDQMKADPLGYYGDLSEAIHYIKEKDEGLYRISGVRTALNPYCSPLYFGIYDSSYYTNINSPTFEFLNEVYPESFINDLGSKYSTGVGADVCLSAVTGYKYLMRVHGSEEALPYGYEYLASVGDIDIYENKEVLSFGISYKKYIKKSKFEKYNDEEQRKLLLFCAVLEDGTDTILKEISDQEAESLLCLEDMEAYMSCVKERQNEAFVVDKWKEDRIEGQADLEEDRIMIFSIPNVKGWKVNVDGVSQEIMEGNIGFMAIELTEGRHVIELTYQPTAFWLSFMLSAAAIAAYIIAVAICKKHSKKG